MRNITPLVAPRSIAVIGASTNPTKSGGVLFDNLVKGNFQGPLYPINRTATQIMGKTAYPTLADVPEKVDLVYIVLPQQHVENAVEQCIAAGARAACIITAGFSEAGPKGRGDEERLREIARASGLLLAGPNTIGMVNAEVGMMGSFVNFPRWKDGGVSFFTQTGIFTGAVMLGLAISCGGAFAEDVTPAKIKAATGAVDGAASAAHAIAHATHNSLCIVLRCHIAHILCAP